MQFYVWTLPLFIINQDPAQFGGHRHSGSGDLMVQN